MGTFMKDDLFEAQMMRALGYAPYGGADIGECLATTARIRKVDSGLWYFDWLDSILNASPDTIASMKSLQPENLSQSR